MCSGMCNKGIFWIKDIEAMDIVVQKIPCDSLGNIFDSSALNLNSKNHDNYNHKKSWEGFEHNVTDGKEFDYYPRGRVEINKGRAKIFLSPYLATDEVIDVLIRIFALSEQNGINSIQVIPDYSKHYRCYLDMYM